MPRAKSRRLSRLLVGSAKPSSRCNRLCKFWVRIRNGSAFSSRASIRQTAGRAGRAGKNASSAPAASNSRPQSRSSTRQGYVKTGRTCLTPFKVIEYLRALHEGQRGSLAPTLQSSCESKALRKRTHRPFHQRWLILMTVARSRYGAR